LDDGDLKVRNRLGLVRRQKNPAAKPASRLEATGDAAQERAQLVRVVERNQASVSNAGGERRRREWQAKPIANDSPASWRIPRPEIADQLAALIDGRYVSRRVEQPRRHAKQQNGTADVGDFSLDAVNRL
jgi:hypothetical protein